MEHLKDAFSKFEDLVVNDDILGCIAAITKLEERLQAERTKLEKMISSECERVGDDLESSESIDLITALYKTRKLFTKSLQDEIVEVYRQTDGTEEDERESPIESASTSASEKNKGPKSAKKPKQKKDPKAPKRAQNAYMFYVNDQRSKYVKENPETKTKEVVSALAAKWREMSDKAKKPYEDMAQKDKERYKDEMLNYSQEDTASTEDNTLQAQKKKTVKNGKVARKKKDVDAPKRAKNAYMFFVNEKREEYVQEHPGSPAKEVVTALAALWRDMSEEEKIPYVEMWTDDKERYKGEMEKYEDKKNNTANVTKKSKK